MNPEPAVPARTKLRRPVRRVVDETSRGRKLVIEVHGLFCRMREYGRHEHYDIPWGAVYSLGGKMQAAVTAREKLTSKAIRKAIS